MKFVVLNWVKTGIAGTGKCGHSLISMKVAWMHSPVVMKNLDLLAGTIHSTSRTLIIKEL